MPLSPGDQIGAYEILAPLGAGGMGQVYRARDIRLGRMAAIKVLPDSLAQDPERRTRLQHEAKLLANLSHPNIAAVYGLEQIGESPALVMELVEGCPLNQMIPKNGMPLREALHCAIQVARGLEAAHRSGIVHRDLKPSNVMVTNAGIIKLLDFGLAKVAARVVSAESDATVTATRTVEGALLGTVAYMSPEQAQGLPVDARSDLFSFGTMLFEMLTGERPFRGDNQASTLAAILREEPKPVTGTVSAPAELDRVVARCLRKSAERRFQTASDLRVALEELAEEVSSGQSVVVAAAARRQIRWWIPASAVLIVLCAAVYWMRPQQSAGPGALRQLTFESGMAIMPALSPDGRMLVYASDRSGEGQLDLWIRQTAGGDPHRLTSDMGGSSNPQFSADGTRVLFLNGNSIFEVSALGGPPHRLVENAGPFTVSPGGDITFVQPRGGIVQPIQMVSASGGGPHEWRSDCKSGTPPAWSPDGKRLAVVGNCGQEFGIYVVPVAGPPVKIHLSATSAQRTLLPNATRVQWYPAVNGETRESLILPMRNGDSMNLYRIALDGTVTPVTQGTGWESGAAVSANGAMVFTRAEYLPTIWSLPLAGNSTPQKLVAPGGLFAVSRDGGKMVFGRMAGIAKGEIVTRDLTNGTETTIASHDVMVGGIGSFWTQVSPDGNQAVYRVNPTPTRVSQCLISLLGGTPACNEMQFRFSLASGWRPDGARIIGECEQGAICEFNPADWGVRQMVRKPAGYELLYPSYSWNGKWLAFMQRGGGVTAIAMARVREDGTLAPSAEWVRISPPEVKAAARPRFTRDGKLIFYIRNEGGVQHLVRQPVDLVAGRPAGAAVVIAPVQIFPAWFADSIGSPTSTVEVSAARAYFNSVELRGNIWTTYRR